MSRELVEYCCRLDSLHVCVSLIKQQQKRRAGKSCQSVSVEHSVNGQSRGEQTLARQRFCSGPGGRGGATGALQPRPTGRGGGDWEVRAAVPQPAYGKGLVYASKAKCGQALGYYGGEAITLQEYYELHEDNGLRHTLWAGGHWVNGYEGVTGMQYANT